MHLIIIPSIRAPNKTGGPLCPPVSIYFISHDLSKLQIVLFFNVGQKAHNVREFLSRALYRLRRNCRCRNHPAAVVPDFKALLPKLGHALLAVAGCGSFQDIHYRVDLVIPVVLFEGVIVRLRQQFAQIAKA